jgi:hypothetical protein
VEAGTIGKGAALASVSLVGEVTASDFGCEHDN